MVGRRGDDDGVERRRLRPAQIAVADARLHVRVAEPRQRRRRLASETVDDLDAVDLVGDLRQHRRLVAAAGSDLEHLGTGRQLEQIGHQRHDVRLRDGLPFADRQRPVAVGGALLLAGHEFVTRHRAHGRQHALVEHGPSRVRGDTRHHLDLLDHLVALGGAKLVGDAHAG